MKYILLGCLVLLSVIGVEGNNDNGALDVDLVSPLPLPEGGSLWFKKEKNFGNSHHGDYNNPNLEFVNPGSAFIGNYQYFNIKCKNQCQVGDEYDLFLTENVQHTGQPPESFAYVVKIV